MFDSPGNQGHPLGLSVGATYVAATHRGHTVVSASEVTIHGQRLSGFVDRVGDPVPLIAPDGSQHRPELLLADALGAVSRSVTEGMPVSDMAVTVPAHWRPPVVDTLRRIMGDNVPVVSDATAALAALSANPGLPGRGVVVLCDFGGSGTSITLANAAANYAVVGETVRFTDFSGDHIDQALLTHVFSGLDVPPNDPMGTAMVGSLAALREECRRAKEQLSAHTATAVAADVTGYRTDIRVTRIELEDLMKAPIASFLAALDDTLEHYGVPAAAVSAVATVGGGARIPLVTQMLSEHLRAPVVTTPQPQLTAAEGATLIALRSRIVETATTITPVAGAGATELFDAGRQSETFRALAWSHDEQGDDVLPYSGPTEVAEYYERPADSRPELRFRHDEWQDETPQRRAPLVLFALAAVAVAITGAIFGLMQLTGAATPVDAATTSVMPSTTPAAPVTTPVPPAPQAPVVTTVVVTQRATPAPRPAPVVVHPPVAPPPTQPWTPEPTTEPTTTQPTTTEPTPPPTDPTPPTDPSTPKPPPTDPGPGDGGTGGTGSGGTGGTDGGNTGTPGTGGTGAGGTGSTPGTGTGTTGSTGTGTGPADSSKGATA